MPIDPADASRDVDQALAGVTWAVAIAQDAIRRLPADKAFTASGRLQDHLRHLSGEPATAFRGEQARRVRQAHGLALLPLADRLSVLDSKPEPYSRAWVGRLLQRASAPTSPATREDES